MAQGDRKRKGDGITGVVNTAKCGSDLSAEERLRVRVEQRRQKLERLKEERGGRELQARAKADRKAKKAQASDDAWMDGKGPDVADLSKPRKRKGRDESEGGVLDDIRWVIQTAISKGGKKGRERLLKMVEDDDRLFVALLKELLRTEAMLDKRRGGNKDGRAALVIIKGFDTPDKKEAQGPVDFSQIRQAIDPAYVKTERLEDDRNRIARPEDQA